MKTLYGLGVVGFFWFLWTGYWGRDGHLVALGFMGIGLVFWLRREGGLLKRSSLFWLGMVATLFVGLRGLVAFWAHPGTLAAQLDGGIGLLKLAGLFPFLLAFWLAEPNKRDRLDWGLGLIIAGLIINIFIILEWGQIVQQLQHRPDFRINPNPLGFVAVVLSLGMVTVGVRWLTRIPAHWGLFHKAGAALGWVLVLGLLIELLLVSQSRANWLAGTIVFPIGAGVVLVTYMHRHLAQGKFWEIIAVGGLLIGLAGGLLVYQFPMIQERVTSESRTWEALAKGDFGDIPHRSIGKRILMLQLGREVFPEKPIFGWGPGTVDKLLADRGDPSIQNYPHLHNIYVEFLVEVGLVGALLFAAMVGISIREVRSAVRRGDLPWEWGIFWLGSLGLLAVSGLFGARVPSEDVQFLLVFLAAIAISCQLKRLRGISYAKPLDPFAL